MAAELSDSTATDGPALSAEAMFSAVLHLEAAFIFESLTAALGVPGKLQLNL